MTVIMITAFSTLAAASILTLLIILLVTSCRLKRANEVLKKDLEDLIRSFDGRTNEIYRALEDSATSLRRDLDGETSTIKQSIVDARKDLNAELDAVVRNIEDVKKYVDQRFDLVMNRVEKDYVRREQTLLAAK